jgi:hypothetical protein
MAENPFLLLGVTGAMIAAEIESQFPSFCAHDGPRISHVGHVADIVDEESDDGARAAFVDGAVLVSVAFGVYAKFILNFVDGFSKGSFGVRGEEAVVDEVLVETVLEEVAALTTSVAVVDCEQLSFDPLFLDVEGDADSVFVVVPGNALVSVNGIALDNPVFFIGCLGRVDGRYFVGISFLFAMQSCG